MATEQIVFNQSNKSITQMNLVLYREKEKMYYCRHLWVPFASIVGEIPQIIAGPYFLTRVQDFRKATGEIQLFADPMKVDKKDYGIWLTWNHEFFSEQNIRCIFISNPAPPPRPAPPTPPEQPANSIQGLFKDNPF